MSVLQSLQHLSKHTHHKIIHSVLQLPQTTAVDDTKHEHHLPPPPASSQSSIPTHNVFNLVHNYKLTPICQMINQGKNPQLPFR